MKPGTASLKQAKDFLTFVNASPSPFHAVKSSIERLERAGFEKIKERDSWSALVKPGGKYYLTRNESSIIAFAVGKKWKPGNPIGMVGAHTDSPVLRLKPVSKRQGEGFLQVAVETYGGGLWHTWFDRDLSIAGRAMVRTKSGQIQSKLVKIDQPLLRIPTLAIHLDRQEKFEFNKETQLFPIAGLVAAELNEHGKSSEKELAESLEKNKLDGKPFSPLKTVAERHHPEIVNTIAQYAGCSAGDILDFEMVLYDTQKACLGGLYDEFVFSARLDNLMMSYCALEGLIGSLDEDSALDSDRTIRLVALFDHEEIGSRSTQGADSNLLPAVIRRLCVLPGFAGNNNHSASRSSDSSYEAVTAEDDVLTAYEQTLSTSFLISADMAHSVHPNYAAKYEAQHRPEMNAGVVVKINANVRYATNSPGIVLLREVAERARPASYKIPGTAVADHGVPLQLFVVRNDSLCGSTIGPMLSAALGARTIDVGNAQLSMHSCRETGGTHDVEHATNLFESFFTHFDEVERTIVVD